MEAGTLGTGVCVSAAVSIAVGSGGSVSVGDEAAVDVNEGGILVLVVR